MLISFTGGRGGGGGGRGGGGGAGGGGGGQGGTTQVVGVELKYQSLHLRYKNLTV